MKSLLSFTEETIEKKNFVVYNFSGGKTFNTFLYISDLFIKITLCRTLTLRHQALHRNFLNLFKVRKKTAKGFFVVLYL